MRFVLLTSLVLLPFGFGAFGPQSGAPVVPGQVAGAGARPPAPPEITAETATGPAAEVFALEQKTEDAVVRGDTAFVDGVLAKDFSFVHGDHWATGGKPQIADDRPAFLKRVTDRVYLVHDLDRVKIEMHPDLAITYGRYVSLTHGRGDTAGRLSTIWFERVYAKRDGRWQWLSHRTVHGPTPSPAGVDPTTSDGEPHYGDGPVWFLRDPAPAPAPPMSADEAEVRQLDQKIANAVVRGDTADVRSMTTADFSMVHGDLWTRGGPANLRDTQESMLSRVTNKAYAVLDFDHIQSEMHGDVAITYGRYLARSNNAGGRGSPDRAWFSVWFERVYQKQNGRWIYLSHRTVHGPTYGPDRQAVSDK
jgi:ketosteroid isomerase-like protein